MAVVYKIKKVAFIYFQTPKNPLKENRYVCRKFFIPITESNVTFRSTKKEPIVFALSHSYPLIHE